VKQPSWKKYSCRSFKSLDFLILETSMYQGKRGTHGNHDNRGKRIRLPPDADSGVSYSEVACLKGTCLAEKDSGIRRATTKKRFASHSPELTKNVTRLIFTGCEGGGVRPAIPFRQVSVPSQPVGEIARWRDLAELR
jgi:hypothetical protein